ncbi:MAG: hypothetical protein AAGF12_37495, partial [Myxococcota bacterium]
VDRGLARDPDGRWSEASDMLRAIERCARGETVPINETPTEDRQALRFGLAPTLLDDSDDVAVEPSRPPVSEQNRSDPANLEPKGAPPSPPLHRSADHPSTLGPPAVDSAATHLSPSSTTPMTVEQLVERAPPRSPSWTLLTVLVLGASLLTIAISGTVAWIVSQPETPTAANGPGSVTPIPVPLDPSSPANDTEATSSTEPSEPHPSADREASVAPSEATLEEATLEEATLEEAALPEEASPRPAETPSAGRMKQGARPTMVRRPAEPVAPNNDALGRFIVHAWRQGCPFPSGHRITFPLQVSAAGGRVTGLQMSAPPEVASCLRGALQGRSLPEEAAAGAVTITINSVSACAIPANSRRFCSGW